jgi:5-methylcytosine-specific restriction protein B
VSILNDAYEAIADKPLVELGRGAALGSAPVYFENFDSLVAAYWTEAALSTIIDAIRDPIAPSRQIILAGPPGTSKTYVAQQLIGYLTDYDPTRSTIVQFHPSYSYEQFLEGLRPTIVDGAVKFEVVGGIVLQMADKCRVSDKPHLLLIDELNRANLSRVLGELMFLFEYRDKKIDLPYTRDFSLLPNLYLIGTMNTADRNIRSIDIALRRRFDVFMCPPDPDVLTRYYADTDRHLGDVSDLVPGFIKLNDRLAKELDEHHTIGHACFMSSHFPLSELQATWTRKIQPLLGEYFFASPDIAEQFVLSDFWPSAIQ